MGDGLDNSLIAITGDAGNGIAILDLTSLPEPQPRGYALSSGVSTRSAYAATPRTRKLVAGPLSTRVQHRTNPVIFHHPG